MDLYDKILNKGDVETIVELIVEDINIWLDIFGLACHHIATNKHRDLKSFEIYLDNM